MRAVGKMLVALIALLFITQPAIAETISIGGSTTVQKYMKLAASVYMVSHPDINFSISGGGSTAGFAQIIDDRVDIGMMSRELSKAEKSQLGMIKQVAVGLDAIVPVISHEVYDAGITKIKPASLARIYRSEIHNWKQLGGPDRRILSVDKNTYHGTRVVFSTYVLGHHNALDASTSVVLDTDRDVIHLIHSSDQAIGYVGIGYVNASIRVLPLDVGDKVIQPSHKNIRDGIYPISRKLYVLVAGKAPDYVKNFVRFLISSQGQKIVARAGYLSLNPARGTP